MNIRILDISAWALRRDLIPTHGVIDITKGHGQGDGHGAGAGIPFLIVKDRAQFRSDGSGSACGSGDGQGQGVGEARNEMMQDYLERMNVPRYRARRRTK